MEIHKIETNKKKYLELLLLADEQESMVDRYLERGDMFVLFSSKMVAIGVAVVTDEGNGVCELKNLAVHPDFQRCGYGRKMVEFRAFISGLRMLFCCVQTGFCCF